MKWIKIGKGIRYREHPTRRYGNHLDRYYTLVYKVDGKTYTESLGWESENREPGRSMLQRAEEMMANIRHNRRTREAPVIKKERQRLEELKQAEAQRKLQQEQLQNITLDEFYEQHFKPFVTRKLTPKTCQTECAHYTNWIKMLLGNIHLSQISLSAWDQLLANLQHSCLSQRSKNYICGTLCRILKLARDRGYKVEIPTMKKLGLRNPENRRLRVITQQELNDIFRELEKININAYRITLFAFYTGCRFGEAAKLKWSDVQDTHIVFRNTKNGTNRIIPIPSQIQEMLTKLPRNLTDYVFTNSYGCQYSEPPASFKLVVEKLHLNENCDTHNKITFHSLRHTAATYMAKYLDVRSLMDIFGWKSITMAARYMHGNENQKQMALNSLSEYLDQPESTKIIPFRNAS